MKYWFIRFANVYIYMTQKPVYSFASEVVLNSNISIPQALNTHSSKKKRKKIDVLGLMVVMGS